MEVRVTIKTTPGRPARAVLIMAALLAAAVVTAWAVSVYKADRPIRLLQPVDLPPLPLRIAPPAGWTRLPPRDSADGLLAVFADPRSPRALLVYLLAAPPTDPESLMGRFYQAGPIVALQPPSRARIGPLDGWQAVIITTDQSQARLQRHILRAAVLAPGFYVLLQLDCSGPPTPWEFRLMDHLADAVQPEPDGYSPPNELADQTGIELSGPAGRWLARIDEKAPPQPELGDRPGGLALTLLPTVQPPQAEGFWGLAQMRVRPARPDADLAKLLPALAAADPGLLFLPPQASQLLRRTLPRLTVEQRPAGAGATDACRIRLPDEHVVRLVYLFRPQAAQAGSGDSPRIPAPAGDRVIYLSVWAALADEPAATAAVERLIPAIRVTAGANTESAAETRDTRTDGPSD